MAWCRLGAVASTQLLGAQDAGFVRKACPTRVLWKLLCLLTLVKKVVCVSEISYPVFGCWYCLTLLVCDTGYLVSGLGLRVSYCLRAWSTECVHPVLSCR